jgi:N-formylglutamate amidohydrolase
MSRLSGERLVVDPERFPNDDEESMALKGMGATYTKLSSGEPLRRLSAADRTALMSEYYYPHHQVLTAATESAIEEAGICLIIDVHSFSSSPLQHEEDQRVDRAEICVGFDAFHSPFSDDVDLISICNRLGFTGSVNRPFSGSIEPSKFWKERSVCLESAGRDCGHYVRRNRVATLDPSRSASAVT